MLDPVGFWSYARLDDEQADGLLSELRAVVGKQIGIKHGGKVSLWQDIAAIPPGANWASEIERAIAQATFFMPIVTPSFLKSPNCLDEFRSYQRRLGVLGRDDLIFPVHYVDVDKIRSSDTVFGRELDTLRRSQWIDFRPLFYADPKSPDVRRWAGIFADSVLQAMQRAPSGVTLVGRGALSAAMIATGSASEKRLAPLASRSPRVLSDAEEGVLEPGDGFKEGIDFPTMVVVPPGTFTMGSPENEEGRYQDEGPQHDVGIARLFAVGKFPVTVDEFRAFVAASEHDAGSVARAWNGKTWESQRGRSWRAPGFAQTGLHPACCINWHDAQTYVNWLSSRTGKTYRLLSEAEWEYAARGRLERGAYPRYFFGDSVADLCRHANGADQTAKAKVPGAEDWIVAPCSDGYAYTSPVGSFSPNSFGLYDMAGNVWEWVEDAYHDRYDGAPTDGASWTENENEVESRVLRGGSWDSGPSVLRAAVRYGGDPEVRGDRVGFRVARTLAP